MAEDYKFAKKKRGAFALVNEGIKEGTTAELSNNYPFSKRKKREATG